jgi:hypothetical protein
MNQSETDSAELARRGGNYSPVTVTNNDTVGATFLGLIAILLLVALLRAEARYRALEKRLSQKS